MFRTFPLLAVLMANRAFRTAIVCVALTAVIVAVVAVAISPAAATHTMPVASGIAWGRGG